MEQNFNHSAGMHAPSPHREARKTYGILGFFMLIMLAGQFLAPVIFSAVIAALGIQIDPTSSNMVATYVGMYCIAFPLGLLLLRRIPREKEQSSENKLNKINWKLSLLMFPAGYTLMVGINVLMTLFQTYVIGKSGSADLSKLTSNQSTAGLMLFIVVVIAPTMEEIIFRYLPFRKASGLGILPYVLWSAVTFGLFHLNFGQTLYATGMGILLGLAMAKTRNIFNGIITHILINFCGMGLSSLLPINIYSIVVVVLLVAGLVCGVILIKTKMLVIHDEADRPKNAPLSPVFLNAGTIVYSLLCIIFIIAMFFIL